MFGKQKERDPTKFQWKQKEAVKLQSAHQFYGRHLGNTSVFVKMD